MDIRRTLRERAGPCDTALGKDCRSGKNIAGRKRKKGALEMLRDQCCMMNCELSKSAATGAARASDEFRTLTIDHSTFPSRLIAALPASPLGEESLGYGSDIRETP